MFIRWYLLALCYTWLLIFPSGCIQKINHSSHDIVLHLSKLQAPWSDVIDSTEVLLILDNQHLEFYFKVIDSSRVIQHQEKLHQGIVHSDRVEIFIADPECSKFYGFEIDRIARLLSFETTFGEKPNLNWEPPSELINYKVKDTDHAYEVAGSIHLQTLEELKLLKNDELLIGIFRADYYDQEDLRKVNWLTWKVPDSENANFHLPSAFGKVRS